VKPPLLPESVSGEDCLYLSECDRRRATPKTTSNVHRTRARTANQLQEHLDHDLVTHLGRSLGRCLHALATPAQLPLSDFRVRVYVHEYPTYSLTAHFGFAQ